jgi:antitoxin CptB
MKAESLAKLNWQCRRGTKELDCMLLGYLHTSYATANVSERQLFQQLLNYEDTELLNFLLVKKCPKESQFTNLVKKICHTPII